MREVQVASGHYYHFYNRGVGCQPIFLCKDNWTFFLQRLHAYFVPGVADIIAYCLMPNHYHLLVEAKCDDVASLAMQPFTVSYSKAVNKQQSRSGHLFQGPFHAKLVDQDSYLKWLSRYIHLNPVAAGLVRHPADWQFSSYRDYIGLRQGKLPHPAIVIEQFVSRQEYARFVEEDLPISTGLPGSVLVPE
jgi:REP element-mobilizing transposase RayT